ncbi:hypothetical protein QR46_0284 [Giardia duodenalis assemblage B]|uniref:Rubicon Homology domain-containing protein n=1 Tax=Giardia duodenalis assemblage B TaxID=1394984 RepID=A0A132P153_GIAIN|nr:hypothetical protein QR46_0284 [Giardia intestinalis assemblage B]
MNTTFPSKKIHMSVYDLSETDLVDALDFLIEYIRYGEEKHDSIWTDKDPVTQRLTEVLACIFTKGSKQEYVWASIGEYVVQQQLQEPLRIFQAISSNSELQHVDEQTKILALTRLLLTEDQFVSLFTGFCESSTSEMYPEPSVVSHAKRRGKVIKYLMRAHDAGAKFQLAMLPPADVVPGTLAQYQLAAIDGKRLYREQAGLNSSQQSTAPSSISSSTVHTAELSQPAPPTPSVVQPSVSTASLNIVVTETKPEPEPKSESKEPQLLPVPAPASLSPEDGLVFERHSEVSFQSNILSTAAPIEKKPLPSTVPDPALSLAKPATVVTPIIAQVPQKPSTQPPAPALAPKPVGYAPAQALSLDTTTDDAALLKSLTKSSSVQLIAGVPINISSGQNKDAIAAKSVQPASLKAAPVPTVSQTMQLESRTTESNPSVSTGLSVSSVKANALTSILPAPSDNRGSETEEVKSIFARANLLIDANKSLLGDTCPTINDELKKITKRVAVVETAIDINTLGDEGLVMDVLSNVPVERAVLSEKGNCEMVSFTGKALVTDSVVNYWVRLATLATEGDGFNKVGKSKHKGKQDRTLGVVPSAPTCSSKTFSFNVEHYTFDKIATGVGSSVTPLLCTENSLSVNTYTYTLKDYSRPSNLSKIITGLQDGKCAGCDSSLSTLSPEEQEGLLFCHYTGRVYCNQCSLIVNKHIIPSKVLSSKRDTTEYTVGAASYKILERYWKQPNLETDYLLSVRMDLDTAFNSCLQKRTKLSQCFKNRDSCVDLANIFSTAEDQAYYYKQHVLSDGTQNFYWSMSDIVSILLNKQIALVERLCNEIQTHSVTCSTCQAIF